MAQNLISIIIPCKDPEADISSLVSDIETQVVSGEKEIIRVDGISPAGKARNLGAQKAKGQILVFIDADIRLKGVDLLAKLAEVISKDEKIAIATASIDIPLEASFFEKNYANQVSHCRTPQVSSITDAGVAGSHCCAILKETFDRAQGFNVNLPRGQDPEFSYRLRQLGFRTVLTPDTMTYHHQPKNLKELIKIHFRNGRAAAYVDKFYPELNIDVNPRSAIYLPRPKNIFIRSLRYIKDVFIALIRAKLLLLLTKLVYLVGYVLGLGQTPNFKK